MPKAHKNIAVELAELHGGKCHYCGVQTSRHVAEDNPIRRTVDHVKPQSEGGPTHISNCVIACFACNGRRGAMPYAAFKARFSAD